MRSSTLVMLILIIGSCTVEKKVDQSPRKINAPSMKISVFDEIKKVVNKDLNFDQELLENSILVYSIILDEEDETVGNSLYPVYEKFSSPYTIDSKKTTSSDTYESVDFLLNSKTGYFESTSQVLTNSNKKIIRYYVEKMSNADIDNLIQEQNEKDENHHILKPENFKLLLLHANLKVKIDEPIQEISDNDLTSYQSVLSITEVSDFDFRSEYRGTSRTMRFSDDNPSWTIQDIKNNRSNKRYSIDSNLLVVSKINRKGNSSSFGLTMEYFQEIK